MGPLAGIRIIELAGIGPGPFCGMMLADHGAEVIRIERPGVAPDPLDPLSRSRKWMSVDIKTPDGVALIRDLVKGADGLIEGFRPGVMERLGLGPDVLLGDNPKLVYGRMTGWGQYGPYAHTAGHDINYIAVSGVLHTVGVGGGRPIPPVNYVGDFGGGGLMLAFAMVSALLAVRCGGDGDVIDAAMTDGSALLSSMTWHGVARGFAEDRPGVNLLDGGAHFYDTYECADGKYVALGAIEPAFYRLIREHLGVADDPAFSEQMNREHWPALKRRVAEIIQTKTRDEWCAGIDQTDACFSPVLSLAEAPKHPHNLARATFVHVSGRTQPAPAPRYARQTLEPPRVCDPERSDRRDILARFGVDAERIARLEAAAVVA
jgi:alpha-methylacyl-CoA racemase